MVESNEKRLKITESIDDKDSVSASPFNHTDDQGGFKIPQPHQSKLLLTPSPVHSKSSQKKKKRPLQDITGDKLIPSDPSMLAENKQYLLLAPRLSKKDNQAKNQSSELEQTKNGSTVFLKKYFNQNDLIEDEVDYEILNPCQH